MTGCPGTNAEAWPDSPSPKGAGASPLFPPLYQTNDDARDALLHLTRRDPHQYGASRSRWSLAALARVCTWLKGVTLPGLWQIMHRLHVTYKRARDYVHSPDPDYIAKLLTIPMHLRATRHQAMPRLVVLFQDEMTYERQPRLANDYALSGHEQPLARRSYGREDTWRIAGALDACTGRVIFRQARTIRIPTLIRFYEQIAAVYADQPTLIYLVQDNWPVHVHPDVLARLIPQTWTVPLYRPKNWPTIPRKTWPEDQRLPIRLVFTPTYASWTNPIEKLWRWLRQDVLHLHRLADEWASLKAQVAQFLAQFATGSRELLRYVGLSALKNVYRSVFHDGTSPPLPD